MTSQQSRRNFLRGTGVALTLPWLESLPLLAADEKPSKAANKPPLRFGCVFFSNGVEPEHWWAKGSGASMEFGPAAKPLTSFGDDLVFLRGLYNQTAFVSTSPHLGRMNLLSGAPVSRTPMISASALRSIRFFHGRSAARPLSRALSWGLSPTNCVWKMACPCSMARPFPGPHPPNQRPKKFILRARLINWLGMGQGAEWIAVFWMPCLLKPTA